MKILYISPAFQHPTVRGPSRCYYFIRELSKRHEITLLTLKRSEIPPKALEEMAAYTRKLLLYDATGSGSNGKAILPDKMKSIFITRHAVNEMKKGFSKLLQEESYDVVLFHGKSVFPVIEDWNELPIVMDFCDATSMRIKDRLRYESPGKRLILRYRYRQFKKVEQKMIEKTPYLAFISSRDRDVTYGKRQGVKIVPIGVDLDFWTRSTHHPQQYCLIFTGVMNYRPNEDAALYLINDILPLLKPGFPDIEVLIVGRDPTPALKEKAKQYPEVTVTGFVDDVRTYLERATVFVAPVRFASGIQNKVLEAFAMEMPVVCTTAVATGLQFDDHEQPPVYVADDPASIADNIASLLKNTTERARLAAEGRQFVERHFIWSQNAKVLEQMCIEAAEASLYR